jgi:hypothetical protein
MPLTTQEKGERFHACPLLGNRSAFFTLTLCSKTNHGERLAVAARRCRRLVRWLSSALETLIDWQIAVYVVWWLMRSVRGIPGHVSSD